MVVAAVRARDLYRFFHAPDEEVFALRGVNLEVAAGEFVAVMGPSGSGKSTLFACIAGLDDPDGGSVEIDGGRMTRQPEDVRARIRANSIGIVLQSGNLFSHLTVAENLHLQRRLARQPATPAQSGLLASLGLERKRNMLPETLSGGEAARAALAVALSAEPIVLLCDEPTGEVDAATEAVVLAILKQQQARGVAILVATHSTALAKEADRIIRIADGSVQ
jgi:putative ABC transport system ATP-binding protein